MNPKILRLSYVAIPGLVMLLGLSACENKDPAAFVASAKSFILKADYKSAIIEAKNALQKDPNNGDARLVLATALLESGDPANAEAELRKAVSLKVAETRTAPLLARALLDQGEFKKVTDEFGDVKLDDPAARTEINIALAAAYLAQGDGVRSKRLLDDALAAEPQNVRALLLQAQLAVAKGDSSTAQSSLDAALKSDPKNLDAMMLKANMSLAARNSEEAQRLLEQAVAVNPGAALPRFSLVSLAVSAGKLDVAKAHLKELQKLAPRDVRTSYSDALVALAEGDAKHARDALQRVLSVRPDHLPSLLLSGIADYELGSFSSAENSLARVIARAPDEASASRILALIYLKKGRAAQALETLAPALRRNPDNALLLRAAGEAYLAAGNAALATKSYERANTVDKNNIGSQVRLAQVRMAAGDTTRALSDLEALSLSNPSNPQADLALFNEHLKKREYDKALEIVATMEKKQPKSATPPTMRGVVELAKRDTRSARASFEKALELQPDYFLAAQNLGLMDLREGNPQAARARYERMLAKNPNNEQALLATADVMAVSGASADQIRATLDKAVRAKPTSVRARLATINYSIRLRDGKAAVASAQAALTAIPGDPQLLEALGTAQRMAGEPNQAAETYKKALQLQPQNLQLMLRLADAQSAIKDYPAAIESVRKVLEVRPDLANAWGVLIGIYLQSGRPEAAMAEAKKLQKEQPNKAVGYALEGELLRIQKKWPEAAAAFGSALSRQSVPALAAREYAALQMAGRTAEARALGEKWMKDNPTDATLLLMLAEESQGKKDYPAAIAGYKRVLDVDPDNATALNNVAWLLAMDKDPKAIEYAENAHRLAPLNPNVLDTLGWTLNRSGQSKRAVQLLRMASSLAPANDEIRLHLAQALADSGDKAAARKEVGELTKSGRSSPVRSEAEKLQATL